jgi:hypothetical protein
MKAHLIPLVCALILPACGGGSTPTPTSGTLPLTSFSVISGGGSPSISSSALSGTGSLVYSEALTAEANNFRLTFTLADGGSLSWVAYASNGLANGLEVRFTRTGNAINTTLRFNGGSESGASQFLASGGNGTIEVFIDAHNGESPSHVLLYPGTTTNFADTNATLNSEGGAFSSWANRGTGGGFFGVRLENASLTEVVASAAKFAD